MAAGPNRTTVPTNLFLCKIRHYGRVMKEYIDHRPSTAKYDIEIEPINGKIWRISTEDFLYKIYKIIMSTSIV